MSTYAQTSDVEKELGRPASSTAQTTQWEVWLERVERSIRRGFKRSGLDLDTQVTAGAPETADVIDVEVAAVLRKIENPNGITSITRSVDDGSITTRREGAQQTGDPLEPTDDEWEALLPDASQDAFTITLGGTPGYADCVDPWA